MTSWDDSTVGGRETVRDVLVDAERRLTAVGVPSPSVDAACIVAYAMSTTRSRLFLQDSMTSDQRVQVEKLLARRLSRVPLQHLLGSAGFRRIDLQVGPGVFIPRPETELVAEAAIRGLSELPAGERIGVDLCSGSGAIAISMALEASGSRIHAVELSDDAIEWTRRNAHSYEELLVSHGSTVEVHHADAITVADPGHPLSRLAGKVGVVASNPPYIPDLMVPREPEVRDHEPRMALYGGEDGLDVVRGVARTAAILLRHGGLMVIEHADVQGQGEAGVPAVLKSFVADAHLSTMADVPAGRPVFETISDRTDLNGLPRFTVARKVGGDLA